MDLNSATETVAASGDMDELLADLDMDALAGTETHEEVIEEMSAADLEVIEQHEAIEAAYDGQETTSTEVSAPETSEAAPVTEKPARKARAAKGTKAPKAPAAPKDLSSIDPAVFVLEDGVTDLEANKATVIGLMPKQKKIQEKFENVFRAVSVGKRPSVYVMATFDVLASAGTATSTELVGALKAAGYNEGTARSQAGQVMVLFDLLGVAKRESQKLTYNADAPMSKRLAALPAAPAAA